MTDRYITPIKKCNCKSKFQDKRYGKSNRIVTGNKDTKRKCTVCNKEKGDK